MRLATLTALIVALGLILAPTATTAPNAIPYGQKGAASGVASLNGSSQLVQELRPAQVTSAQIEAGTTEDPLVGHASHAAFETLKAGGIASSAVTLPKLGVPKGSKGVGKGVCVGSGETELEWCALGGSLPEWLTGKNEVSCSAGKAKLNYEKYAYYIVKTSEACTLEPEKIGATELQPMTIKLEITGTHTVKLPAEAIWIGGEPALNAAGTYYFSVTVVGESGKSAVATPANIIGQGEVGSSSCTVPSESVASGSLLYKEEATGCKAKWEAKHKYHRIDTKSWDFIGAVPNEAKTLGGFFVAKYGANETQTMGAMICKTKEGKVKAKLINGGKAVGTGEAEFEPTAKEQTLSTEQTLVSGKFVELEVQSSKEFESKPATNLYCTLGIESVQSE